MHLLICFALKEEAAPFRKIAAGKSGLSILLTGVGRTNAEKSVREFLLINSPELVLACGFAGGLNPDLKLGDVVFEIFPISSRGDEAQTEIGNRQSAISQSLLTSSPTKSWLPPARSPRKFSAPTASPPPSPTRKNCALKPVRTRWRWNRR